MTITDQGRRVIASANMAGEEVGEQLFGWLSPQQRRELHQALKLFIQAADPAHQPSGSHPRVIQEPGP